MKKLLSFSLILLLSACNIKEDQSLNNNKIPMDQKSLQAYIQETQDYNTKLETQKIEENPELKYYGDSIISITEGIKLIIEKNGFILEELTSEFIESDEILRRFDEKQNSNDIRREFLNYLQDNIKTMNLEKTRPDVNNIIDTSYLDTVTKIIGPRIIYYGDDISTQSLYIFELEDNHDAIDWILFSSFNADPETPEYVIVHGNILILINDGFVVDINAFEVEVQEMLKKPEY